MDGCARNGNGRADPNTSETSNYMWINSLRQRSIPGVSGPLFAIQTCVISTTVGQIIVIASAPMLATLRRQLNWQPNTQIFCETDFLAAMEVILAEKPEVIALDPIFASTARGAALVSRVKADPQLCGSEIRTLVRDGVDDPLNPAAESAPALPTQPLDSFGTRRAPRYTMGCDVEAKVNGTPGRLVNLSVTGSQMLAPIRLRPCEGIRVTLMDEDSDLRLSGLVAWVSLEIAARSNGQRYRFGVEFHDADERALDGFCARHRDDR